MKNFKLLFCTFFLNSSFFSYAIERHSGDNNMTYQERKNIRGEQNELRNKLIESEQKERENLLRQELIKCLNDELNLVNSLQEEVEKKEKVTQGVQDINEDRYKQGIMKKLKLLYGYAADPHFQGEKEKDLFGELKKRLDDGIDAAIRMLPREKLRKKFSKSKKRINELHLFLMSNNKS